MGGRTAGTQTAGLIYGGQDTYPATNQLAVTEAWNGSAWTEVSDLNTARREIAASGSSTAALAIAGNVSGSAVANMESYNGSSWTETTDVNTARRLLGGSGTSTSTLVFGGAHPNKTNTESWNGSAWTEVADLAQARYGLGSAGTNNTSALAFGGNAPPNVTSTEEWSFSGLDPSSTPAAGYSDALAGQVYYNTSLGQFKIINDGGAPIGSWSSGGDLNQGGYRMQGGAGTLTAGLVAGRAHPNKANVELYDGTSWTEAADLDSARADVGVCGLQTAALSVGGSGVTASVEHFNGSSWTEGGDLPAGRERTGTFGIQTAAIAFGGRSGSTYDSTLEYNGSSWTSGGDFLSAAYNQASAGTYTAGIAMGGYVSDNNSDTAAIYDGTSWSEITEISNPRAETGWSGRGTQTATYIVGGTSPESGKTEAWNGSAWTEVADLATSRNAMGSSGNNSAAFVAGGNPGTTYQGTEEFTSTDFEIKTVTTS